MAIVSLQQLGPYSQGGIIRVRVCRVWKNRLRSEDADYSTFEGVLVDYKGNSIHFTSDIGDLHVFEPALQPGKIYRISGFYPRRITKSSIVSDAICMLEFRAMTINIQEDNEPGCNIPRHKFNLVDFSNLEPRRRNNRVLTDIIGHLKGAQPLMSVLCEGKRLENKRDVFIENIRGEERRIVLWGEQTAIYDDEAVAQADQPIIVVFTSTKVTDFKGEQCLNSSSSTLMFLNPDSPELLPYKKAFAASLTSLEPLPSPGPIILRDDEIISKPRITLRELQTMDPAQNREKTFFCEATIQRINLRQGWYYNACPNCTFSLKDRNGTTCHEHGVPIKPLPWYKIELVAVDKTETATFMLMGKVAQAFLDEPAAKYATGSKEIDDKHLPHEIADKLLQKTFIFQLRFGSPKHSYGRNDLLVAAIANPDKAAQQLRLKALAEPTAFPLIKGSSSATSADLSLSVQLHTPDLPHEKSVPDPATLLPPSAPSNAKRKVLFPSDDKPDDACSPFTQEKQTDINSQSSMDKISRKKIKTSTEDKTTTFMSSTYDDDDYHED